MPNPTHGLVDRGIRPMLSPTQVYIDGGTGPLFLPRPAMFVLSCLGLRNNLLQAQKMKKE